MVGRQPTSEAWPACAVTTASSPPRHRSSRSSRSCSGPSALPPSAREPSRHPSLSRTDGPREPSKWAASECSGYERGGPRPDRHGCGPRGAHDRGPPRAGDDAVRPPILTVTRSVTCAPRPSRRRTPRAVIGRLDGVPYDDGRRRAGAGRRDPDQHAHLHLRRGRDRQIVVGGSAIYPAQGPTLAQGAIMTRPIQGGSGRFAGVTRSATSERFEDDSWRHVLYLGRGAPKIAGPDATGACADARGPHAARPTFRPAGRAHRGARHHARGPRADVASVSDRPGARALALHRSRSGPSFPAAHPTPGRSDGEDHHRRARVRGHPPVTGRSSPMDGTSTVIRTRHVRPASWRHDHRGSRSRDYGARTADQASSSSSRRPSTRRGAPLSNPLELASLPRRSARSRSRARLADLASDRADPCEGL